MYVGVSDTSPWTTSADSLLKSSLASGNVFPGAAVPFGVVKIGIDTASTIVPGTTENGGL
jgi:putative alpha-1,2-mannosidase